MAKTKGRYEFPNPEEGVLPGQERGEPAVSKEVITTSITYSNQKEKWSEKRILLDGVQNHLPADCKGTWFAVLVLKDGRWTPYQECRDFAHLEAVRFVDNGQGFVAQELSVISSSKAEDDNAAGVHGEGLKMISAAALRCGMRIVIESRDWKAEARWQDILLTDRSDKQLVFDVSYYATARVGSRTTFWNPSQKFRAILAEAEKHVLPLQGKSYQPWFSCEAGDIIEPGHAQFVQGLAFPPHVNVLFVYNFQSLKRQSLARDRDHITWSDLTDNIAAIFNQLNKDNRDVIAKIWDAMINTTSIVYLLEVMAFRYINKSVRKLFGEVLTQCYGQVSDLCVVTDDEEANKVEDLGRKPLKVVNSEVADMLKEMGVAEASDIIQKELNIALEDRTSDATAKAAEAETLWEANMAAQGTIRKLGKVLAIAAGATVILAVTSLLIYNRLTTAKQAFSDTEVKLNKTETALVAVMVEMEENEKKLSRIEKIRPLQDILKYYEMDVKVERVYTQDELTPIERKNLALFVQRIDRKLHLPPYPIQDLVIFDGNVDGLWRDNKVWINRSHLNNFVQFANAYVHERIHQLAKTEDCSPTFQNTATEWLARLLNQQFVDSR